MASVSRQEDFLNIFRALLLAQEILLQQLCEKDLWNRENKANLNQIREQYLELNNKNISRFSAKKKDANTHRQLNSQINNCLKKIKRLQSELHSQGNCCPQCRFC